MSKKSINKWIIWLVIWTTITWVAWGLATTKKGKEVISKTKNWLLGKISWALDFMSDWLKQIKKDLWDEDSETKNKKK